MLCYFLGAFHKGRGKHFLIDLLNDLFNFLIIFNNLFNNYLIVTATVLENSQALASLCWKGSSFVKCTPSLLQWIVPLTLRKERQT